MAFKDNLILMSSWEVWKESVFQKLFTYHLPPASALLQSKDLSGLNVIVTGSTSGIGLHTAKEIAMAGANVTMACRNVKAAKEIASMWKEEVHNIRVLNVEVMELDLVSFSSVRQFADEWEQRDKPLHLLISNAGMLALGESEKFTSEGLEQHMHVNHVAPSLLTLLLLPSLLKAPSSRIIHVNSVVHHLGVVEPQYWNSKSDQSICSIEAYASSKLVHMMFLKSLASKLSDRNNASIQCIAVHPGAVCTNLNEGSKRKIFFMYDAAEGSRSPIFCATSDSVTENLVKGFAYYSCSCKPGKVAAKAEDLDACSVVWQKTLDILELKDDYLSQVLDKQ
ncbi:Dehydrogenase/reductase SDR family member FEY [Thalictrum thalictroides]|uniref:Dehydrogenase/reductase SDR family member FEY n=1 Tax=Thalictrum thalictroides TaxID=46969 RepID=A0A7J6VZ00_THATH|nr:Dehydrogenase/reductase SDR family member FEY [Thalictrum thalictroides]